MTNSNPSSTQQLPSNCRWIPIAILIVSFLGFLDASYLTIEHYRNVVPPCTLTSGCETVLTSSYAVMLGVPTSLWGALFYVIVFLLTLSYRNAPNRKRTLLLLEIVTIGFLASLMFLYLQIYVLKSLCIYCLGSLGTSTLLFVAGLLLAILSRSVWQPPGVSR